MNELNNIIIFELLVKTSENPQGEEQLYNLVKDKITWRNFLNVMSEFLKSDFCDDTNGYIITDFGLKEYNRLKDKIENDERISKRAEDKAEFDFQISKLQAKTKFLPYFISALGLIISGFALYYSIKPYSVKQPEKLLKQSEIKSVKDSILISIQTKMVDSLHNPKNHNNIQNLK